MKSHISTNNMMLSNCGPCTFNGTLSVASKDAVCEFNSGFFPVVFLLWHSPYYCFFFWVIMFLIQELIEELGIYFLSFDRAGYGESDPNPKRSIKSEAFDIQELADQLQLGDTFYVLGFSMGGYPIWGCLKFIPHRYHTYSNVGS